MNSHEVQKKMADVIFESKQGGKPVTIEGFGGERFTLSDFFWCDDCQEFHFHFYPDGPM